MNPCDTRLPYLIYSHGSTYMALCIAADCGIASLIHTFQSWSGYRKSSYECRRHFFHRQTLINTSQEVEHERGLSTKELFLTNHDLQIVEPARRKWTAFNFVGFWIADSFNINTWMIAGSSLDTGLSWWQAWICVWCVSPSFAITLILTSSKDWIQHLWLFHLHDRSHWCSLSHLVPCCE